MPFDGRIISRISAVSVEASSRPLFEYFVHTASKSICCHKGIHQQLCSTLIPMAMETPYLLNAVLAFSAAHRRSTGLACEFDHPETLSQLGRALSSLRPGHNEQAFATTLLQCLADIISSKASWQVHLRGASALIHSTSTFLKRKFQALQAIALVVGPYEYCEPGLPEDDYIDDLAGYSHRLLGIFREINDLPLVSEDCLTCEEHSFCHSFLEHRSLLLYQRVRTLLSSRKMAFDCHLEDSVGRDLYILDEAYHHMAILQIFRRGSLPVPRQAIKGSVQSIIEAISSMEFHKDVCPSVATLPPLFVAGTWCSTASERRSIQELLRVLWMNFGMGNVPATLKYLEQLWKEDGQGSCSKPPHVTRLTVSDVHLDVLPY